MSEILKWFPNTDKIKEPREQQVEVLQWFEAKLSEGCKKFVICAPTGSGKSGVAKAVANYSASKGLPVEITSPLNSLVEQYREFEKDRKFPLKTLTGKKNYDCRASQLLKQEKVSCEFGFCAANICTMDYKNNNSRKLKIYAERSCEKCEHPEGNKCPCHSCTYRRALKEFKESLIGNSNFTLLQMHVTNNPKVLIIDECDAMETFIRMFRKVTIDEPWRFEDFNDYVLCIEDKKLAYEVEYNRLDNSFDTVRRRKVLKEKIEKIDMLLTDIKENNEKYIVSDHYEESTPFEPVSVTRFIDDALNTEERIVILMSATAQKIPGWEFIEVKSPFPKEIRPFKFVPVGSMALKGRSQTIPKLAEMLVHDKDNVLLPGKTIVHVPSYAVAEELGREIYRIGKGNTKCIVQTNKDIIEDLDTTSRSGAIEKFKRSKNPSQIFIAVNMGRGIDLPEEDIKNNVITYVKRQNPTDHLTRAKWKFFGKEWEYKEAADEIMQQYGRVNRHDRKTTNTIITEPEWLPFYRKYKKYFREWFIEAIVG